MTHCVSSYEHACLQQLGAISWEYQYFTSSPPSTYAVNSPPYRYGKTKLSFRLYLICLVLFLSFCDRFNGFNWFCVNPLTPNYHYSGRTASLTSKRCILYIYSTNIRTEYFKHGICYPCFSLKNAVYFIILTYLVPVLFTFYIQVVLKLKKKIPAPKC